MTKSEKTTLLSSNAQPTYAFESSVMRRRKRQLQQFQCCICVVIAFGLAAIFTIAVTFNLDDLQIKNFTTNDTSLSEFVPIDNLLQLSENHFNSTVNSDKYKESIAAVEGEVTCRKLMDKVNPKLNTESPSYRHQMATATSNKSLSLSQFGYVEELATRYYRRTHEAHPAFICANSTSQDITLCSSFSNISCGVYKKFRSYDGQCNNLKYPATHGVAYKPYRRLLPPDYADGVSLPRVAKNGKPLPSARTISSTVHRPYFHNDPKFTVMLAVWGQFLDHDITSTALSRKSDGNAISCCAEDLLEHPECFPVQLSTEDPYYAKYNITCMEFVRSAPAPTCCLGPRQQLNQVSSYIDGSVVYGSDENTVMMLRTLKNGTLKMYVNDDNRTLLPISEDPNDGCNREDQRKLGRYCFLSGDARANENLHLTSMHLIWARQHNLLASNLSELNPLWNDERIFQEARRILAAQMQHITYNEFLPILLGSKLLKKHDLLPQVDGYFHGYDPNLDASVANSFASAAFRFAHSLIPTLVRFTANDTSSYVKLHEILFDPFLLYRTGELDKILRGATNEQMQTNDQFFSPELKHHLFERNAEKPNAAKTCGLDLVSLNIQRGRDHGLPGYVNWRESCGLLRPHTFNQLTRDIDADSLNYIQSAYRNLGDIDLYTGALSEKPMEGSILGPTLNCLILDQFVRLKKGDRYWYENPHQPQSFSPDQLLEIRKTTLAGILCENSDDLKEIQPHVLEQQTENNENVDCQNLPRTDLLAWTDSLSHVSVSNSILAVNHRDTTRTYGTGLNGQTYIKKPDLS